MKALFLVSTVFYLFLETHAQSTTFHLGLKMEFYTYTSQEISEYTTYSKKIDISPIPAVYVLASHDLSKVISVFIKPGLSFRPVTGNFEFGLGAIYKLGEPEFFLIAGVNTYFNLTEESKSNIYFAVIGIGFQFTDVLALDISFHQALNSDFAFDTHNKHANGWEGPSKLFNMVKFGLVATF